MNELQWEPFHLDELFTNFHGKRLNRENRVGGALPMLTATETNQGISEYICNSDMETYSTCITIDMFGHAYYHNYKCTGDDNIYFFINDSIPSSAKQYIVTCINKNCRKFSYGKQFRQRNADKEIVYLPVKEKHVPDFDYMSMVIDKMVSKKKYRYKAYCEKRLSDIDLKADILSLMDKEWQPFFIHAIFEKPQRGKRIVEKNHLEGNIPLVSSYGQKNGVTKFIGNEEKVRRFSDSISIANGGSSAGKAFYHPYTFIAADHVTQCWNKNLNKYQYLFLTTVMTKALTGKYSFSHEISDPRLAKERIMLPVTERGEPDYEYMEQYIKNLMIKKYQSYLDYVEK